MDFSYIEIIILGIVQGLTEFLPISSSGHLVLAKNVLSIQEVPVTYDIFFHFATLLAVVTWFFSDINRMLKTVYYGIPAAIKKENIRFFYRQNADFRLVWYIIIGTIPAAFTGILFEDTIKSLFSSPHAVSIFLIITGCILLSTRLITKQQSEISAVKALIVGVGQAVALFPGVSRSGTTISTALWTRISPERAAKFSFFLSIPVILGAVLVEFASVPLEMLKSQVVMLLVGGAAAFFSGLVAISIVMKVIVRGKFFWFGIYCLLLGGVSLIMI